MLLFSITTTPNDKQFVSRGGLKLAHALKEFEVDVAGLVCADFGCSTGGFTDCLLQNGAVKVYAIDTGYNVIDYKLRSDDRVVVMERTNALHVGLPDDVKGVDIITIDLSWTRQQHAIPAALNWLKSDASKTGRIISLIKPHYETNKQEKADWLVDGALQGERAEQVLNRVLSEFPSYGAEVLGCTTSPIKGGKSSRKKKGQGNVEYLVLAKPIAQIS